MIVNMAEVVGEMNGEGTVDQKSEMDGSGRFSTVEILKEHERLDVLLSKIPLKAQTRFLKTCDLILTCIDASSSHIVLGSNIGLIFVFSRTDSSMQKIKVTTPDHMITTVKLHEGPDPMVAVGTSVGLLSVYCFPSKVVPTEKKEMQKFEVRDVHRNYITCLEWSTNGMKLCSGDTKGHVVVTEIDFFEDKCTSMVLLIDAGNEIVQLSYAQKVLAVSTTTKSYIVRMDMGGQIVDIGTEDGGKMPCKFGACIIPSVYRTEDVQVYTARQDCCLWLADVKGELKSQHSFPYPFSSDVQQIPLHSPKKEVTMDEFQFGKLKMFRDKDVVTWYNSGVVILDPTENKVVLFQNRFDSIVDMAVVNSGEIFVLQRSVGTRVVRVAYKPDPKLGIAYDMPLLLQLPTISVTKAAEGGKDDLNIPNTHGNSNSIGTNIKRSSSITNIMAATNQSGSAAISFIKKNLVKPLKKFEHHKTQDLESRVITSDNIPDAKVVSENEGQEDCPEPHSSPTSPLPKTDDNSNLALSFIKKSIVNPLKKLDQHINPDTERMMITENIPNAKILTETKPQEVSLGINEDIPMGPRHARSFENINRDNFVDEEDSIVVPHKTKKHKKKKGKKGSHVAPIAEHKKGPVEILENGTVAEEISIDEKYSDNFKDIDNDESTLEVLRRADKLLHKISQENKTRERQGTIGGGGGQSLTSPNPVQINVADVDIGMEAEVDKAGEVSHSVTSEEEVITSVSDDSTKLEQSAESLGKSLSTEHESSSEHSRTNFESEMMISHDDRRLESEVTYCNRTISKHENNDHSAFNYVESGFGSSPDSLNDCVERALESLGFDNDSSKNAEEKLYEEGRAVDSIQSTDKETATPLPVTPNSAVQNYVGFFDSVEESPLEDLYGRSVYSIGSADTIVYEAGAAARQSVRPFAALNTYGNSYCAPFDTVKYQFQNIAPQTDINMWSESKTPTNIYSVSMSDTHVFYTDKTENIYYLVAKEKSGSVSWKKASGKANQISVSPSGHIVWSLHKKVVYAGTKICPKHPEGLKWVENVRNVDCISVDNNSAWYITQGGSVIVETKLSLESPIGRPKKIACPFKLKYVLCRYGVVWAITERLQLLVRVGITENCLEGKEWMLQTRCEPPFMFNHVTIGHDEVGWAVDFLGQLWFCSGVNMDNPMGCGRWWQVPLMDSLLHDESTRHLIKEVAQKFDPVKFSHIISTSRGGLVTVGMLGIYLALDFNNTFNVCRGSMQGYQWLNGPPSPLPSTSAWKLLCAGASHTNTGFVWAQHVNKDLYAFKQVNGEAKLIDNTHSFICMSANIFTVWGLTSDGRIMTRIGIDDFCPEGTSWQHLDLMQLRDVQIVHLSCSWMYVWAVDVDGQVYHRIGAKVDTPNQLCPIWLPIDNFSQILFTKVFAGPEEWMVWAIDNRRMIYTRKGVKDTLPIGKEWVHIAGIQAMDIALSRSGVWALTPSGEVYYRQQVSKDNICGKHWKKIPGLFNKISASADDDLWGITLDGELRQCNTQHVWRPENDLEFFGQGGRNRSPSSPNKEDELEWELV